MAMFDEEEEEVAEDDNQEQEEKDEEPEINPFIVPDKFTPNYNLENIENMEDRTVFEDRDLEQVYMAIGFRTVSLSHEHEPTFDILKVILAGNMSSVLFTNLRENNGITYNVSIDNSNFESNGIFAILTSVDREKLTTFKDGDNLRQGALPVIIESLNPLCKEGITQEQLDLAKGYIKGTIAIQCEDSHNISSYNGKNILFNSKFKNTPMSQLYETKYDNISIEDVNSIILNYMNKDNIYYYFIGKNTEELKDKVKITQNSYTCQYNKNDLRNAIKDILSLEQTSLEDKTNEDSDTIDISLQSKLIDEIDRLKNENDNLKNKNKELEELVASSDSE